MSTVQIPPWQAAAQQTWDAMPWYQKAMVSYGKGASDVVRKDVMTPAKWAAERLGLTKKGSTARYQAQTEDLNRGFEGLRGIGPQIGADVGETATLLPAAMATDGAVDAALPEVAGRGMMGAARRLAPLSAGGAALGGLETENRKEAAMLGAGLPIAFSALGPMGSAVGFPLMNALHRAGLLSGRNALRLLEAPLLAHGYATAAKHELPRLAKTVAQPISVVKDAVKERVMGPAKTRLRRVLSQQGSQMAVPEGETPSQPQR